MLEQVVVEALTRNVKEDHVREIFGKYGVIKDLRMPMNPTSYILYEEVDEAERAIAKMHDAQLDGARIQVSIVLPKRRFSQTPPPARRGPPPRERFQDDFDGGYGRGDDHQEGVDLLAHTDHHPWMDRDVIAPHPAACRRIEEIGDVAGAVVEDEEAMAVDHGRIQDLEAARRGEAYHVLRTVDHHQERHQDAEAEEGEGISQT
ncbi:hypothetical protein CFE70_009728 [Pyrenophora teres f. teres 0-1]